MVVFNKYFIFKLELKSKLTLRLKNSCNSIMNCFFLIIKLDKTRRDDSIIYSYYRDMGANFGKKSTNDI